MSPQLKLKLLTLYIANPPKRKRKKCRKGNYPSENNKP